MTTSRPCLVGHGSALAGDSSNAYAMGLTAAAKCQCDSQKQATLCYARKRQATTPSWGAGKKKTWQCLSSSSTHGPSFNPVSTRFHICYLWAWAFTSPAGAVACLITENPPLPHYGTKLIAQSYAIFAIAAGALLLQGRKPSRLFFGRDLATQPSEP